LLGTEGKNASGSKRDGIKNNDSYHKQKDGRAYTQFLSESQGGSPEHGPNIRIITERHARGGGRGDNLIAGLYEGVGSDRLGIQRQEGGTGKGAARERRKYVEKVLQAENKKSGESPHTAKLSTSLSKERFLGKLKKDGETF